MKNLIVSVCGDNSMHRIWMDGESKPDFDLFVVYYGESGERFKSDGKYYDQAKGTKFLILDQIAKRRPDVFEEYDAIMIPDDDLLLDASVLNHFFSIFHQYELQLAQPAIIGWMSVPIVAPFFGNLLRYVNWVEIMTPCFSRDAFKKCLHTFPENRTNWGLEYLWFKELGFPEDKVAIVDDAVGIHTRPCFFGDTYSRNQNTFEGAMQEFYELLCRNGLREDRKTFGSVPLDMKEWDNRPSEKKFYPNCPMLMKKIQEFHTKRVMMI